LDSLAENLVGEDIVLQGEGGGGGSEAGEVAGIGEDVQAGCGFQLVKHRVHQQVKRTAPKNIRKYIDDMAQKKGSGVLDLSPFKPIGMTCQF
jgi:hypothetical protein